LIEELLCDRYETARNLCELLVRCARLFSTGSDVGQGVGIAARLLLAHAMV
jgi:hypothetical protein